MDVGAGVAVGAALLGGAWLLSRKQGDVAGNGLVTPFQAIRDIIVSVPIPPAAPAAPAAPAGPDWAAIIAAISNRPSPALPDIPAIVKAIAGSVPQAAAIAQTPQAPVDVAAMVSKAAKDALDKANADAIAQAAKDAMEKAKEFWFPTGEEQDARSIVTTIKDKAQDAADMLESLTEDWEFVPVSNGAIRNLFEANPWEPMKDAVQSVAQGVTDVPALADMGEKVKEAVTGAAAQAKEALKPGGIIGLGLDMAGFLADVAGTMKGNFERIGKIPTLFPFNILGGQD